MNIKKCPWTLGTVTCDCGLLYSSKALKVYSDSEFWALCTHTHSPALLCKKTWRSLLCGFLRKGHFSRSCRSARLSVLLWLRCQKSTSHRVFTLTLSTPHPHLHPPSCGTHWARLSEKVSVCELYIGMACSSCSACHGFGSRAKPLVLCALAECTERTWCSLRLLERCSRCPVWKKQTKWSNFNTSESDQECTIKTNGHVLFLTYI